MRFGEHCENWKSTKDKNICLSCYWAFPEKYSHVAMRQIRRVDLVWQGEEVAQYEKLKADAASGPSLKPCDLMVFGEGSPGTADKPTKYRQRHFLRRRPLRRWTLGPVALSGSRRL